MSKAPESIRKHLAAYTKRYPGAWKSFDFLRSTRGRDLPDWPEWCWCPLAGAYAIVGGGGSTPFNCLNDIGILGALAAWRMTQGIYRFDADMFAALWDTPVDGRLPIEVLYQLPEWCVYIEAPQGEQRQLNGWFAHLEYDINTGRPELRFVIDRDAGLSPYVMHLTDPTLEACIQKTIEEVTRQAQAHQVDFEMPEEGYAEYAALLSPMISVSLYLCSLSADIADLRGKREKPENPAPKKTKKGMRMFPQPETTWLVGYRIGATIRLAEHKPTGEPGGGSHASPRPHIRRAHWHAYWTGPRKQPAKRRLILKWLPPVSVGTGEIVPTIRRVE